MKILEPTLILPSAQLSVNAAGATAEMDFDFGNLEGAKIFAVEYFATIGNETTGVVEVGLNFNGTSAAPASSGDLAGNEDVFAFINYNVTDATTVGFDTFNAPRLILAELDIFILSNLAVQAFNSGGVARLIRARVYFKRVQFTQSELGGRVAVRR